MEPDCILNLNNYLLDEMSLSISLPRLYRVVGQSMIPVFFPGDLVLICPAKTYHIGDAILVRKPNSSLLLLKSLSHWEGEMAFLLGHNISESVDSRFFGPVSKRAILGKVVWHWASRPRGFY